DVNVTDPICDPFWPPCPALALPIGLHPFLSPDMPGACRGLGFNTMRNAGVEYGDASNPATPVRNPGNIYFTQALANPFDMMESLALFTAGGVCERFPTLRILFLEANGGRILPFLHPL